MLCKTQWIIGLALVMTTLTACNQKREKQLCKRWQVSDVLFINQEESLVQSDTMQGDIQQQTRVMLKDVMMKNIYEFNADGTYMTGNAAATASGEWSFSGNNIRFISHKSDGQKNKLIPIEKLQDDTLIFVLKHDQTTLQMKLILTPLKR